MKTSTYLAASSLALALGFASPASAVVYDLSGGPCGTADCGDVTVTQSGGNLTVTVAVAPNYIIQTGTHQFVAFNIPSLTNAQVTATVLTENPDIAAVTRAPGTSFTNPGAPGTFNFAFDCDCGPGASQATIQTFTFTVDAPVNLTEASLTILSADLGVVNANGTVVATGVAWTQPPSAVPLPGAFLLMGTVLAGGAGFAKFRRKAVKA